MRFRERHIYAGAFYAAVFLAVLEGLRKDPPSYGACDLDALAKCGDLPLYANSPAQVYLCMIQYRQDLKPACKSELEALYPTLPDVVLHSQDPHYPCKEMQASHCSGKTAEEELALCVATVDQNLVPLECQAKTLAWLQQNPKSCVITAHARCRHLDIERQTQCVLENRSMFKDENCQNWIGLVDNVYQSMSFKQQ